MKHIDIQPPNDIYDTFGRLNYKPWYALAEFVDNATQNFFTHEALIAECDGEALLDIDISHSEKDRRMTIEDTAHGMDWEELQRALRIAAPPPDTSGRSEFGMGMKTAACWFGTRWTIETTQLGADTTLTVVFDIEELKKSGQNALVVLEEPANVREHGTRITIENLRRPIKGQQVKKVRELLTAMYRRDLVSEKVQITWNGDALQYVPPALWEFEREDGTRHEARQVVDIEVQDPATGESHKVRGWVGLLATLSSGASNGFDLLRRGRLIIGGPNEQWRPIQLCGSSGSHSWKRLVGELELDDFPVNFTKDGFAWEGGLDEALVEALTPLVANYKSIASNLRVREGKPGADDFKRAVHEMQGGVEEPGFKQEVAIAATPPAPGMPKPHEVVEKAAAEQVPQQLTVDTFMGVIKATLYVKSEGMSRPWLSLSAVTNEDIDVLLNLDHPFVAGAILDERGRTLIGKFALSLAISEQVARLVNGESVAPDSVRTFLNTFLAHSGA